MSSNIKQVRALEEIECINFCSIPQSKPTHGPLKKEIINWLKQLNHEQLKSVMSFTSSKLVKIILLMIQNNKQLGVHMYMLYPATPEDIDLVKQWSSTFYLRPVEGNFSSSLIVGGNVTKNENIEILLNGIRIVDGLEVYDTLCLSDDLLKNINETLLILDQLTNNKIFEQQWFDPCRQDFVTQYIIHGIQKGIEMRFMFQKSQLMQQITSNQIFWLVHSMEPKEKGEFAEIVFTEAQNDEYYQLFIKKLPNNQEEFINEVLELFTDQDDINEILSNTIYDYDNLKHFVARKMIDKLFHQQRRPPQQDIPQQTQQISGKKKDKKKKNSVTHDSVAELSKIFTSHNQSEVLPNSKIQKQMQGYLFSTPPNLEIIDSPQQDKNGYNEINSCPDYNHKSEKADSICEIMQLSHNFTTKCIDEVLKKASQEELELQHIIKDKKKQLKGNKKKQHILAENSDKVSQVTSIDNMSSITALKTSIQQDDSGSSQNWQGGSASQQGEIDFSMDQQVFSKKQRRKLKLKLKKNQNQEKKQKIQGLPIQCDEQKIIGQIELVVDNGKISDNEICKQIEEQKKIESESQIKSDDSFIEVESRRNIKRKKPYKLDYKSQVSDSNSSLYTEKKYTSKYKQQNQSHKKLQDIVPVVLCKSFSDTGASSVKLDTKPKEKLEESKQVEPRVLEVVERQTSTPQPQTVERVKGHQIKLRKKNEVLAKSKIQRKDHTLLYKKEDQQFLDSVSNDLFEYRMTDHIKSFCNHTRSQFEKHNVAREIVFLRIQSIVRFQFQRMGGDAKKFGSCETGLALPDSDIDISILGFYVQQVFQAMEELLEILVQYKWVVKFKPIYTAQVPILKLEIDPSISFDSYTHPFPPVDFKSQALNFDSSKIPSRIFQVDITFETLQIPMNYYPRIHVGLSSTDAIFTWKRQHKGFEELTLILKSILKKKNLNDAYKGGISSFCLAVMLAAVYQEQQLIQHTNQGYGHLGLFKMLKQFLYKYGMEFDPTSSAVCLGQQSGFITLDENPISLSRLTVYSPLTNQVISAGAVSAPIFEEFKKFYLTLQDLQKKLTNQIQKYISPEKLKEIGSERSSVKEIYRQLPQDLVEDKAFFFNYLQ